MKTRKEIQQIALDARKSCKCTDQIFYFDGGFGRTNFGGKANCVSLYFDDVPDSVRTRVAVSGLVHVDSLRDIKEIPEWLLAARDC